MVLKAETLQVESAIVSAKVIDGVTVVNICRLLEQLYGKEWYRVDYETSTADIKKWIEEHDGTYYGAPREKFSYWSAAAKAKKLGKRLVVVEDMS